MNRLVTNDGEKCGLDGGESMGCALVGDRLARLAGTNHWGGIIVSGCIRDAAVIAGIDIRIKALGTNPGKSVKRQTGEREVAVTFSGVTFTPGA